MTVTKQEGAALGYLVVGLLIGIVCLVSDMFGGPSYLHAFTFVGGIAFGYGVVTLVRSTIRRRRGETEDLPLR